MHTLYLKSLVTIAKSPVCAMRIIPIRLFLEEERPTLLKLIYQIGDEDVHAGLMFSYENALCTFKGFFDEANIATFCLHKLYEIAARINSSLILFKIDATFDVVDGTVRLEPFFLTSTIFDLG